MSSTPPWAKIEAEGLFGILKGFTVWTEKPAFSWLALPNFLTLAFAPQVHVIAEIGLRIVETSAVTVSAHFVPHRLNTAATDATEPPIALR